MPVSKQVIHLANRRTHMQDMLSRLPALAPTLEAALSQRQRTAADENEDDEEEVYLLLDFCGAELPPGTELRGNLVIEVRLRRHARAWRATNAQARPPLPQDLDSAAPSVQLGSHVLRGTYDEDVGSTLLFDRASLKRTAESHERALRDLIFEEPRPGDEPLVCVTAKRLRLRPATTTGRAEPHPQLAPQSAAVAPRAKTQDTDGSEATPTGT